MLRLPPSRIELTRKEVLDFLDRHKRECDAQRQISAGTWAQHQLQLMTLARQPIPRLYRGAERSRDDSLTDSTLVASSPSAAMNDRDEFEMEDLEGYTSEAEESDENSLAGHVDAQSLRRDSAMSQEIRVAIGRKPPGVRVSDMMGSLQLDGASSSTQQHVPVRPEVTRPSPSQRRHSRLRSSSDPGEPLPVSVQRYRPRLFPPRANTTSDLSLTPDTTNNRNSTGGRLPLNTIADGLSDDEAEYYDAWRRPAAHHVVYHRQSPLEELAAGAARLNIQNSVDSSRRSPSGFAQFPTFEDNSIRSASNASGLSVPQVQQRTASQPDPPSLSNIPEISTASPTSSSLPASPNSSAAERLRAFADSFSPFMRRISPQRRQDRPSVMSRHESSPAPRYSLATMRSPDWTPTDTVVPTNRPRLTELAIGRSAQSFVASPSLPAISRTSRRAMLDEEQENNDDMTELEEEARVYRQRMESASTQDDGTGSRDRDDRTPPRQGRFMRFLGRN